MGKSNTRDDKLGPPEGYGTLVRVETEGREYLITDDLRSEVYGGKPTIVLRKIRVDVQFLGGSSAMGDQTGLSKVFENDGSSSGVFGSPPSPPKTGWMLESGYSSTLERRATFSVKGGANVRLTEEGVEVGEHLIPWEDTGDDAERNCDMREQAFFEGIPVSNELAALLVRSTATSKSDDSQLFADLLQELQFIVDHTQAPVSGWPMCNVVPLLNDDRTSLLEWVMAMPWSHASKLDLATPSSKQWLEAQHPGSPLRTGR